jgi:predicted DNA-binding transcriptional regulator AlpA
MRGLLGGKMSEPSKKIIPLRQDAAPPDKMLVMMNAGELRELIGEIVEQKLKRVTAWRAGELLNAEQAAEFLGYSKDWVYKNWQRIGGGKKIAGKGLRFDAAELQKWVESRNGA